MLAWKTKTNFRSRHHFTCKLHFDTEFAFYKEVNWAIGDKLLLLFTIRSEQTIKKIIKIKAPNNIFHTNRNKFLKTVEQQQLTKPLYLEILFCHTSNMETQVKKAFQLVTVRTWGGGGGGGGSIPHNYSISLCQKGIISLQKTNQQTKKWH